MDISSIYLSAFYLKKNNNNNNQNQQKHIKNKWKLQNSFPFIGGFACCKFFLTSFWGFFFSI